MMLRLERPVIESIGRTTILVRDQDEALRFFTEQFGFRVIADIALENGFRALHVGPNGSETGFWLMPANGEEQQAQVGRQLAGEPLAVLYTADCAATIAGLSSNGVEIRVPVTRESGAIFAHVLDLYGNEFVIVELVA
jgi:catechol 2,3-dioxygenase-like lactoylglutathione lyase family enzyme